MSDDAASTLRSRRAREFVRYLTTAAEFPFATLISADAENDMDVVVVDVEAELPQRRAVDIRDHELIRIEFWVDDGAPPQPIALRDDFPIGLVHTNYSTRDDRCWLCLWEESWAEARTRLDPETYLERLRAWLTRTAAGDNHAAGQPLEPLLQTTSNTLIVPADVVAERLPLAVAGIADDGLATVMRLAPNGRGGRFEIFEIDVPATVQRAFVRMPGTLASLEQVAAGLGASFIERFRVWLRDDARRRSEMVLLLLRIPVLASAGGPVEHVEIRAFTTLTDTGQVGIAMGVLIAGSGGQQPMLRMPAGEADPASIRLVPWRVVHRLDRQAARRLSGTPGDGKMHIVAVGAGAIGSNVVDAAARSGFAKWTVVDDDVVLPHNTVRQVQGDRHVGLGKARSLAEIVEERLAEAGVADAIVANVLDPGEQKAALDDAVRTADLLLDLTASPAALRALTAMPAKRVASLFFGPDGNDLVLLAEPEGRAVTIDEIEAQYFWACAEAPQLEGHLDSGRVDFIRYANACQDLTRPLPPWKVLTLSAIGARQVELLLTSQPASSAAMWRLDEATGQVARIEIPVTGVSRATFGVWTVTVSAHARAEIERQRQQGLPAETGGVLLGTVDLERRSMHVTGTVPAPRDSCHAPAFFIRGAEGLRERVDGLRKKTAGVVSYIGEWHSHPVGAATHPSAEDEKLFSHLEEKLGPVSRPYCMAIAGDAGFWLRLGVSGEIQGEYRWSKL